MQRYKSNSDKWNIREVPKEYFAFRLFHLHNGNDPDGSKRFEFCANGKRPAKMVTVALIKDRATGVTVASGVAVCSNRDTPSRRLGGHVALGRAVKAFFNGFGHSLGDAILTSRDLSRKSEERFNSMVMGTH